MYFDKYIKIQLIGQNWFQSSSKDLKILKLVLLRNRQ